ncbi:hypothetical protein ACQCQO_21435, partial [Ralstonia pseudosolanacearum]
MVLALGCGVARAQFTGMPSGNGADPGAVSPDGVSGRHAGAWHGHRGTPLGECRAEEVDGDARRLLRAEFH